MRDFTPDPAAVDGPPPISARRLAALRTLAERGATEAERAAAATRAAPYAHLPAEPAGDEWPYTSATIEIPERGGYGRARRKAAAVIVRAHGCNVRTDPPGGAFSGGSLALDITGARATVGYLVEALPRLFEQIDQAVKEPRAAYRRRLRRIPDDERPEGSIDSAARAWTKEFILGWGHAYARLLWEAQRRALPAAGDGSDAQEPAGAGDAARPWECGAVAVTRQTVAESADIVRAESLVRAGQAMRAVRAREERERVTGGGPVAELGGGES